LRGWQSSIRWVYLLLRRYIQTGKNTLEWLKKQPKDSIDAVILYNSHTSYHIRLYEYVKERGIPLVVDRTEWYDPGSCVGGRFGLFRWDVEATLRYWAPRADGAIAISSYLEKHFSSRGCHVLRVPPLVDVQEAKWPAQEKKRESGAVLELAFAGHAGKKDYLVNAVRGLGLLGDSAKSVRFVLMGPTRDELEANLGADAVLLEKLKDQFEFTGRLPHSQALARVAECDFSILLRPDARYAQAGFPTKLVESLGCGVPILGNLTSDVGMYVRDGIEGVVVENCSPEAFAGGLKRALALSLDQRKAMRFHARRSAQESFDYRNWSERLGGFMTAVLERKVQTC